MAQIENSTNHPETRNVVVPIFFDTVPVRVSVQCVDNPEGQNGEVVYDSISYRHQHTTNTNDERMLTGMSQQEDLMVSVQCVDNPEGQNGEVVYDSISYRLQHNTDTNDEGMFTDMLPGEDVKVSVQCEDNPEDQHGQVVFDRTSYRLSLTNTDIDDEGIDMLVEEDLGEESHHSFMHFNNYDCISEND